MTPGELSARIADGRAPAILDVRSGVEFRRGHIPGAVHVPFWLMPLRVGDIPFDRNQPVVVYCGHGPRARLAGGVLRRHGFRHVSYLRGHYAAWARAKLPVSRTAGRPT